MIVLLPEGAARAADPVLEILKNNKVAVVGLSGKPWRASHEIAAYLKEHGYHTTGVNPNEKAVLGEKCYARLQDVPGPVEIVDIFRKAEDVPPVVDDAIAKGAKVIWMQLGIENRAAAEKALAAGMTVVMDACILVEHRKRLRELTSCA
ncbi:MAG TPA: CoA-binding protein [Methylomirabilota bacterium]|nr:CoA-binding protein [Methylomirabilota bacterium]